MLHWSHAGARTCPEVQMSAHVFERSTQQCASDMQTSDRKPLRCCSHAAVTRCTLKRMIVRRQTAGRLRAKSNPRPLFHTAPDAAGSVVYLTPSNQKFCATPWRRETNIWSLFPVIPKQGTYNLIRYEKWHFVSRRFPRAQFIGSLLWVCLLWVLFTVVNSA